MEGPGLGPGKMSKVCRGVGSGYALLDGGWGTGSISHCGCRLRRKTGGQTVLGTTLELLMEFQGHDLQDTLLPCHFLCPVRCGGKRLRLLQLPNPQIQDP